jgi:outer membrane usher protein
VLHRFIVSIQFILLISSTSLADDQIFSQVFGKKPVIEETNLPLFDSGRYLGEITVKLENERILEVEKKGLVIALRETLDDSSYNTFLRLESPWVGAIHDGFTIVFDPAELKCNLVIDPLLKKAQALPLQNNSRHLMSADALKPAPLAGAITSRVEHSFSSSSEKLGTKLTRGQFDGFLHYRKIVLESEGQYLSTENDKWFRGPTRFVVDSSSTFIRTQAGDITTQSIGVLPFRQLGGVSIARNFNLNPYRNNLPSAAQEFLLVNSSRVNTFVNGALVRSEFLQPGRYELTQIPLNNGLNSIVVEATDDSGQKQVFQFQQTSSLQLLHPGETRFDLSAGYQSIDRGRELRYLTDDNEVVSGFVQYGWNNWLTTGLYAQQEGSFAMQGGEFTFALPVGLISMGSAHGKNRDYGGQYYSFLYQINQIGRHWYNNRQLNLSVDHRDQDFQTQVQTNLNRLKTQYRLQLSMAPFRQLSTTLGLSLGKLREASADRKGIDLGLNFRLSHLASLSLFANRQWDEFKQKQDQVYAFLTWSFPSKGFYSQSSYNSSLNSYRVSVASDRQNKLNTFRTQASIEQNTNVHLGDIDLLYVAAVADLGVRTLWEESRSIGGVENRITLRGGTTLAFARDKQGIHAEFMRPQSTSFAMFVAPDHDGPLDLRGVGIHSEGGRGPFGNALYSNLIPYQYREVSLDPINLKPGQSFNRERFVLLPRYKSGHLIRVHVTGSLSLRLRLEDEDFEPLTLQSGQMRPVDQESDGLDIRAVFTNRQGHLFVDGLRPAHYELVISGFEPIKLDLTDYKNHSQILEMGAIKAVRESRL